MHKIKPSHNSNKKIANKFVSSYNSLESLSNSSVVILSDNEVKNKTDKLRGLSVNLLLIPKFYDKEKDWPEIYNYLRAGLTPNGRIAYY